MKLVLHIGVAKTGTTAVQKHLYDNREWLLERGVYLPRTGLGRDNGHARLLDTLDGPELAALAAELQVAKSAGYHSAIVSWEGMGFYNSRDIRRLIEGLCWDNVHVLVYLREQADFVQTGYLQGLKTDPSPFGIADFQPGFPTRARFAALLYRYALKWNYARMLKQWARFIPKGRFIVREYQSDLLANRNVVDDVLAALGQVADSEFSRASNTLNISLDVESALIINRLDRHNSDATLRRAQVFTLLSLVKSDGAGAHYFLSRRQVASIRRCYRGSNAAVGRIVGSNLPAMFASPPDCVRSHSDRSILQSTIERQRRFDALLAIPMLLVSRRPHELPSRELLAAGWSRREDWGAWSVAGSSTLRFRIPFWMTIHAQGEVVIGLKGRYTGSVTRTGVIVNGLDFGALDLRGFTHKIRLPVTALYANEVIEVRLTHIDQLEAGGTPVPATEHQPAFGIECFGIQFAFPDRPRAANEAGDA